MPTTTSTLLSSNVPASWDPRFTRVGGARENRRSVSRIRAKRRCSGLKAARLAPPRTAILATCTMRSARKACLLNTNGTPEAALFSGQYRGRNTAIGRLLGSFDASTTRDTGSRRSRHSARILPSTPRACLWSIFYELQRNMQGSGCRYPSFPFSSL